MNILIQPSSLSLVGSMNHVVINTEKEVSFVLNDSGGNAIVKHLYVPSDTNRIEVDLKNIILPLLTFKLQDVSSPYQQTGIVKSFSATVTETGDGGETKSFSFTVIRAGVDHFDGDASSFLTQNFLTWQPNVKPVTYYTPEFLTYYAVVAATIRCKAYFEDGTTQTIALAQIAAGECWTVPVQYAVIAGKVGNKLPQYYEVWAENASGSRLTYIQRYVASDMRSEEEEWILFENSLGGIDTFRAYGNSENTAKHTHNVAEIEEDFEEYRVDTTREHKKNTGYLGNRERVWLLDFFPSTGKFVYTDNFIRRIVVTESDVSYNAKELPSSYNFTYKYADARPYLNLPRAELPQKVLNIKLPDLGSFTVAPRLAEFPRLTLSGGALFPVENPYSEQWTVTTAAAILEYLIHQIEADYSGNGGIGHTHPNINLLNGLYLLEDYLLANGNKIKAGYADEAKRLTTDSPVYKQFLRKDKDDSTLYNLGVERSLKVGQDLNVNADAAVGGSLNVAINTKSQDLEVTNQATTEKIVVNDTSVFGGTMSSKLFRSGFLDGYGWSLFKQVVENALGVGEDKYTLEIDNLIVRQSMRVYEMIISQLLGENDNRVFTAMMEVDHYEASSGKVYFNNHDGKLYNPFRKYDYVMVQQYNPSATDGWVIKHYELIIAEIGSDSDSEGNRKDWVKFYNFTSSSGASASELITNGDTFVRVDNAVDPERKGIVTITTVGANTPYVDIVHGLKTDPRHAMKGRIGNLEGLQTEQFGWLKGFGEYLSNLYAVGHFKLASTGENVSARIEANSQQLSSTYSETTYNIKEEDNYIPNGMFAQGLDKWGVVDSDGLKEIKNDLTDEEKGTNLVTVTDGTNTVPLFLNGATVGTKHTHHAVAETFDGTKVAHLYECGIFQPWSQLKANGTHAKYPTDASKSEEYEQNTLYFAIRFLAVTSGVLTLEFHDDEDTSDISTVISWNISASDQWQMKESNNKSANWKYDPSKKGRLIITYSGEMLVRFVTLTDVPLDDFKQSVSTQFLQTANSIKLLGENYNALSGDLTNLGIELRAADKEIRLYVDKQTSDAETRLGVRIDGVEEKVSLYASKLESDYYTKSEIDVKVDEINSSVSGINTKLSGMDDDISGLQSQIDATNNSVSSLQNSLNNLDSYIDGAFADGIIEQSEKIAIEKYLKTLEGTKKDLDSSYTELINNSYLDASSEEYKNLGNAKTSLNQCYDNLVNAINSAIADDKATADEKKSVDTAFDNFNNAISNFSTYVKKAEEYIRVKIAEAAENRAKEWARQLAIDAAKAEVYTQSVNPWTQWASGKEKEHVGAVWHYSRASGSSSDPTIYLVNGTSEFVNDGSTYRYVGYDNSNKWECINDIAVSASYILQNKDYISAVVANFDKNGNVLDASGIVTTATGNTIYASKQSTSTNLFMGTARGDGWGFEHSSGYAEKSFSEADRQFYLKNFYALDIEGYIGDNAYATLISPVVRVEKGKKYIVSVNLLKASNVDFSIRIDDGSTENNLGVRLTKNVSEMTHISKYDESGYYRYYYVFKAENNYVQIRFINSINKSTVTTSSSSANEYISGDWPYGTNLNEHTVSDTTTVDYGDGTKQSVVKTRVVVKHRYAGTAKGGQYLKVTETTTTTAPSGNLWIRKLQLEKAANNSDSDKPSEYKEGQNTIESYIRQTAESITVYADNIILNGKHKLALKSGTFTIDSDNLTIDEKGNVGITGNVTATSGKIGDFLISGLNLVAKNGGYILINLSSHREIQIGSNAAAALVYALTDQENVPAGYFSAYNRNYIALKTQGNVQMNALPTTKPTTSGYLYVGTDGIIRQS